METGNTCLHQNKKWLWALLGMVFLVLTLKPKFLFPVPIKTQDDSIDYTQKPLQVLTTFEHSTSQLFKTPSHLIEVELIKAFAEYHGWKLNFKKVSSKQEALTALSLNKGHLALSFFTQPEKTTKNFLHTNSMGQINQVLVCHKSVSTNKQKKTSVQIIQNHKLPKKIEHLLSQLLPMKKEILINKSLHTTDILRRVNRQKNFCTVTNHFIYEQYKKVLLKIRQFTTLKKGDEIVWILAQNEHALKKKIHLWFTQFKKSSYYEQLYTAAEENVDFYEHHVFLKKTARLLPQYIRHFRKAAQKYNIPWKLIAAMAYQESHWNPRARSFTGVRGLMMLTQDTAKFTGVKNRLNPIESIWGGTKYLHYLLKKIPSEIKGKDRAKFALAAYNIGLGHIFDARKLAQNLNLNPNNWKTIESVLPLLSLEKYAKNLRHGKARGNEPVQYVKKIARFYQLLQLSYNM